MPVSEDEFERPNGGQQHLSKAEQRKSNKPIMEKRRRARINHCLNELKTLILDAMKKDPARHSKLEKADILEMTVKHLQQIQRQQLATAVATDPAVIMRFKSGFDECAAEVGRYIGRLDGVDTGVKQRLTAHLHRCVSSIQQIAAFPHQTMFSALTQNCDKSPFLLPNGPSVPGDVNNNSNQNAERIHISSGLHLIPSRLPTGELALLVPNSNHSSTFLNPPTATTTFQFPHGAATVNLGSVAGNQLSTTHMSAFTAVGKNQDYPSPTSSADVVKKESPAEAETETVSYNEHSFLPNYSFKVTDEKMADEQLFKKIKVSTSESSPQKFDKFKTFGPKTDNFDQKIAQKPSSSSFQRTVADSTTSFIQTAKGRDDSEPGFKPFHVDIPDTHLKARVSISEATAEDFKISLPILQKSNPNLTINPKRIRQSSPQKSARTVVPCEGVFSEVGYEKLLKLEPLTVVTKSNREESTGGEKFPNVEGPTPEKGIKRPFYTVSPEVASPTSSDSSCRTPRISLNLTLKDDRSQEEERSEGRCKRISVIVEDSSKRESNNEVTVNVSSQKDMWRPW